MPSSSISTDRADLSPGSLVWAELEPVAGREQGGRRPVVVVASRIMLDTVTSLAIVVPLTRRDRGWPNHVSVEHAGLAGPSFAMPEQLRAVDRSRLHGAIGTVDAATLAEIRTWIDDFLC